MENNMKMASLNMNSDRRVEQDGPTKRAFNDFSLEHRYPTTERFIESLVQTKHVNCFALQEIDENALRRLKATFDRLNFNYVTTSYCLDRGSFFFMFAYDATKMAVLDEDQCYYTESGLPTTDEDRKILTRDEKFQRHLDVEFEKSAQVFTLHTFEDDKRYCVANTHPGLTNKHRLLAMQKLVDFIEARQTRMGGESRTIVVGDMNQFDTRVCEPRTWMDQVQVLTAAGYCWQSAGLEHEGAKSTFLSFPYDIFRFLSGDEKTQLKTLETANDPIALRRFYLDKCKTISVMGGCLDGCYTLGDVSINKVKAFTFFGDRLVNASKSNAAELQEQYLSAIHPDEVCSDAVPASDHMGLVISIG